MATLFGLAAWLWRRSAVLVDPEAPLQTELLPRESPATQLLPRESPATQLLPAEPATELLPAERTELIDRTGPPAATAGFDDDDDGTVFTPRQLPAQLGIDEQTKEPSS